VNETEFRSNLTHKVTNFVTTRQNVKVPSERGFDALDTRHFITLEGVINSF